MGQYISFHIVYGFGVPEELSDEELKTLINEHNGYDHGIEIYFGGNFMYHDISKVIGVEIQSGYNWITELTLKDWKKVTPEVVKTLREIRDKFDYAPRLEPLLVINYG